MPVDHALHKACNTGELDRVRELVEQKGEEPDEFETEEELVNAPGAADRRPIHRAAAANHVEIIKYLVEKGAIVNQADKSQRTAIHWAAISGNVDAGKALLEAGADIFAATGSGMTALHAACESGRAEFVDFLMQHAGERLEEMCNMKDENDKLPFDLAMAGKHKAVVQNLKSLGDPNAASASCVIS